MTDRPKRPTLRDIAAETGLSQAAVSYALRGLQVPAGTQERVRAAAERLGYHADPVARALASGRTGYVGVLCRSLEDIWQQSLVAALGRGLTTVGLHGLILDASNDPLLEASLAQRLVDQRVDALVVLPVDPKAPQWADLAQRTVLLSIGDSLPGAATAAEVVFDNVLGVTDALTRLRDLGHTRVTVLTPVGVATPDRPAEDVVRTTAHRLGMDVDLVTAPHDIDGSEVVALEVLSRDRRPTALLCLADSMAYGAYAAARSLGLEIPDDLSVLGFDDHPVSRLLSPPLSTYRWPIDELVTAVVDRTVKAVDGRRRTRRTVLTASPQMRRSHGPAPEAAAG